VAARSDRRRTAGHVVINTVASGQICRDLTCKTFKIAVVLGPSRKSDKLRVCRWQTTGKYWSAPCALLDHQLEPISPDFDLTSRRGQVVAAAKRSIVDGLVRWKVGPRHSGDALTEVHHVGTVRP
jgi:hypothetical protein